jgi:membrane-associated protease RseP (regulator of RpoE activity)
MASIKKNEKKDRSFGLIIGIFLIGYSGYVYFYLDSINPWLLVTGLLITLAALILPRFIYPLRVAMEAIGHWMGIVNTYILLTLIYFILFIPVSLLFKITGKDNLKLKRDKRVSTYWVEKTPQNESSMKNQF